MTDDELELLRAWIDGTLPADRRPAAEALLQRPEARRYLGEHRALWQALGEAFREEPVEVSADFRAQTVRRALSEERREAFTARRFAVALAAGLLIALGLFSLARRAPGPGGDALDPRDHEVVRHLHVLQDLELVERWSAELDLRSQLDVLAAFAGEQEGEGG